MSSTHTAQHYISRLQQVALVKNLLDFLVSSAADRGFFLGGFWIDITLALTDLEMGIVVLDLYKLLLLLQESKY